VTRGELKNYIRGITDEIDALYLTDDLLNMWLNLAQKHVQGALLQAGQNWYEQIAETLTVIGQADYVIPADFRELHRLELVTSGTGTFETRKPIKEITTNQQDFVPISLGEPFVYIIKKNRVTLSPTPDIANLVLRLYYSPLVDDMTSDADEPDVPEEFHEYVGIVAALNVFIKDDRVPNNLLVKKQEYEKMLKDMADDRTVDAPRSVNMIGNYPGDGTGWYF